MKRRLLLDNDGTNLFDLTLTENIDRDVQETVRECPSCVTTYLLCPNCCGKYFHPTRVGEVFPESKMLLAAQAKGKDPFGDVLRGIKDAGREVLITYRMNDVHGAADPNHPGASKFKIDNPRFMINPNALNEKNVEWMAYCLDYSHPEVREYYLATIRELIEMYSETIDGFQLDWMRFPKHLSGTKDEVWAKRTLLTDFIKEVRTILDHAKPNAILGARIPTTLSGCHYLGADIEEWTHQKLVDYLVITPFLTSDYFIDIESFREITPNSLPLYTDIEMTHNGQQYLNPESLRAIGLTHYDLGSDGLYLFNFPCWTEHLVARPYDWLENIATPEDASRRPLLFSIPHKRVRIEEIDRPGILPLEVSPNETQKIQWYLPTSAREGWRGLVHIHTERDITLCVNETPAEEIPTRRYGELFMEHRPLHNKPGMERPEPQHIRVFRFLPSNCLAGFNTLTITAEQTTEIKRINIGIW